MEKELVSIVVPIYNAEKYLDKCLESIVNQSHRNLEIILIDDGSTDKSSFMCDQYAEKDSRVRVVHKQNQGQGIARNVGIDMATGKYICFFDSDDYVALDLVEKAYAVIKKEKADVVAYGHHLVSETGKVINTFEPCMEEPSYQGELLRTYFIPELIAPNHRCREKRKLYMSLWSMMYSMELIRANGWQFASERDIFSEDVYSLLDLFQYVKTAAVVPEALYCYRTNEGSFSRKYRPNQYERVKQFYLQSVSLCCKAGYDPEVILRMADPYLSFTRAVMKQEVSADLPYKTRLRNVEMIVQDQVLQDALHHRKRENGGIGRRIMFSAMKSKSAIACFALCYIKTFRHRK